MSLTRKDVEDLKPLIDNVVYKFLGFSEPTLVHAAVNCLDKGYDKRKTVGRSLLTAAADRLWLNNSVGF